MVHSAGRSGTFSLGLLFPYKTAPFNWLYSNSQFLEKLQLLFVVHLFQLADAASAHLDFLAGFEFKEHTVRDAVRLIPGHKPFSTVITDHIFSSYKSRETGSASRVGQRGKELSSSSASSVLKGGEPARSLCRAVPADISLSCSSYRDNHRLSGAGL